MKAFVYIIQKTGYVIACIGMAGMDSRDRLLPVCLIVAGGLMMYGAERKAKDVRADGSSGTHSGNREMEAEAGRKG
ncbi:hypothetical protein AALA79_01920 [Lachnospiraceae bacterium 64-25]